MKQKLFHSNNLLIAAAVGLFICGLLVLWVASLRIPALEDLSERRVDSSTKIYDRTGEVLLYDMARDARRAPVAFENISPYAINATIAIEDRDFYSHKGFQWTSFLRAVLVNITSLSFKQGGSTITQQVVKNSILTTDKTPTRKLKELILALKLERVLTKQEILTLYLNEIPYGGTIYGIEEAARSFFGKPASNLSLPESAYLAALLKAPTYYSPYGSHRDELELRKNLVLKEMYDNKFITEDEYNQALKEVVEFKPRTNTGSILAPHFVFFVIEELAKKYGEDTLANSGLKVITTLDYNLQQKAEEVSKKYGDINQTRFHANNNGMVAVDPKTGDILMMVGSRNYFDTSIDGNFNVTTGYRQPGSTFKPFVYATMFDKGYTDTTILYDVPIQFSPNCAPNDLTTNDTCYAPGNYDDKFRGPMTIRNALAQSVNLPAVQAVYLAGLRDSIDTAKRMGINSLNEISRYGLSIVLGGGEVSLLDMTSAYSVFANDGVRNSYNAVLSVEDAQDNVIERASPLPQRVMNEETVRMINDILSDNAARTPGFGPNSALYIPTRPVAVKTGTSNDYRDAWIIGYAPNIAVGAWVGNTDNSPMTKNVSGLIVAPLWKEYMTEILDQFAVEEFIPPQKDYSGLKPILAGDWQTGGVHSILYWVDKDNPRGPVPSNPASDPQFNNWEYSVSHWASGTLFGNTQTNTNTTTEPNTNPQPLPPNFIPTTQDGAPAI